MGYYITETGKYYEGDKANKHHIEITKKPSVSHSWDGSVWNMDIEIHKEMKITKLDKLYATWFKFKRTMSPQNIRNSYWDTVDAINAGTTAEEIDTTYTDNEKDVLGLV